MAAVSLLKEEPKIVNVGVKLFYESLKQQGAKVVHVSWQPPARGDEKLLELLKKLSKRKERM